MGVADDGLLAYREVRGYLELVIAGKKWEPGQH
jgi:hypothetical protein